MTAAEFKASWDACVCAGSANPESRTFQMLDAGLKAIEENAKLRVARDALIYALEDDALCEFKRTSLPCAERGLPEMEFCTGCLVALVIDRARRIA